MDTNHERETVFRDPVEMPKTVGVPKYNAPTSSPGIVHFGVGNFHRAHQAVYLDDLFNSGSDHDWAIVGAGVRDPDIDGAREARGAGLAHDRRRAGSGVRAPRMSPASMVDFVKPFDVAANLAMLDGPRIRIVSLTVTEGGYYVSPATQTF